MMAGKIEEEREAITKGECLYKEDCEFDDVCPPDLHCDSVYCEKQSRCMCRRKNKLTIPCHIF
jgi:hypothetical protein